MPLVFENDGLLDTMTHWSLTGVHAAVVLVDETVNDPDESKDRAVRHRLQSALLVRAARHGFRICVVHFGAEGKHGNKALFNGGLGEELNSVIPEGMTYKYSKGAYETNGFANTSLRTDLTEAGITDVVIMGQSVNACCAATAIGASDAGMTVHTCMSIVRGGHVATTDPAPPLIYQGQQFSGWPPGTKIYSRL